MAVVKHILSIKRWPKYYRRMCTTVSNEIPEYNYGLSGPGKVSKKIWKKHQPNKPLETKGEIVFGIHPVSLALSSHHRHSIYRLYIDSQLKQSVASPAISHIQDLAAQRHVPTEFVPKTTLLYMAGNRPHQGVCLDASDRVLPETNSQDLVYNADLSSNSMWLMLYNVQDPMNFGAILRSSYYLGVDRVIVPNVNSCAISPVVSKASAGALEVMDLHQIDGSYQSIRDLTEAWQQRRGKVLGTTSDTENTRPVSSLQDFTLSAPTLLIIGNEGSGVDPDVLDLCDSLLTIPPPSMLVSSLAVQSLNVSVATGIMIYWLRASKVNP